MTIIEQIESIINDTSKWNYYQDQNLTWQYKNISDVELCYDFIREYVGCSNKNTVSFEKHIEAMRNYSENEIPGKRLCHIVSVFFLGLAMYNYNDYLKREIDQELLSLNVFDEHDNMKTEFIFIWFMISMFHDLGYVFEKDIISKNYRLTDLIADKTELINSIDNIPTFDKMPAHYRKIIIRYLKYRENKDHGILGGLSFAKHVCDLRKQKYDSSPNKETKKMWKPELDKLYKYVAWRICCHNIFYIRPGDDDIEYVLKYFYYGLFHLMLCNRKTETGCYVDYPISFKESPLFFFLCLVDSIDPMKVCDKIPQDLEIKCDSKGHLYISCSVEKYMKKVEEIKKWLVRKEDNYYIL